MTRHEPRTVRTSRRSYLATTGAIATLGLAGCIGASGGGGQSGPSIDEVEDALAAYQDVGAAIADGYRSTHEYVVEDPGGMGIHFVNDRRMRSAPDATKPPILFYDLTDSGEYELMGAEWFVPADAVEEAPSLMGQTFDGPMEGHGPGQPRHYDLHAWLFRENPEGQFAQFNPDVSPPTFVESVARARASIADFTEAAAAERSGYEPEGECVAAEAGGMGTHYVDTAVRGLDVERPQILLYDERDDGSRELLGAEWFVPAAAVDETPVLFGQAFDGPMEGHGPDQPRHYDLHAWLFATNPNGMFSPFNPTVDC